MEHDSDGNTSCHRWALYSKGTGRIGNKGMSEDHLNYNNIKIDQNTEKNPRNLRRLAVVQTPVESRQQKLAWKTFKDVK